MKFLTDGFFQWRHYLKSFGLSGACLTTWSAVMHCGSEPVDRKAADN
jgi:hypothetical protein